MQLIKSGLFMLAVSLGSVLAAAPQDRGAASTGHTSPRVLVAELYRKDARKHSPFFQTRSRALLTKYFTKGLADLIWKDQINAKGEVGALDGDPLYDAQDMEIKNIKIHPPRVDDGVTRVPVSFLNFGKNVEIKFVVVSKAGVWKIDNIEYHEGTTLRDILQGH